nr:MAG: hypothetical protein H2Rhizo31535_000006 [Cystoviridae sp.]
MDWLKLFVALASGLASTTVGVLHATGADKHKTIAGQIAGGLGIAAAAAQATHDALTPAPDQTGAPTPPPLTAGTVP